MNRIDLRFKYLKATKQKAFIAFLTAGFPSLDITKRLILDFAKLGVDVIEVGVPFSDPLADGPTIQVSSNYALGKGVNLNKIFSMIYKIRRKTNIPICLMSYYNPILKFGITRFIKACNLAGVDGVIVPDLPPEEAKELVQCAKKGKVDVISFLSPTSGINRVKLVDKVASGFIYYVSLTGVTGARSNLSKDIKKHISQIKEYSKKPVCVGFGISQPKHVKQINKFADGVIVGSAVIKIIEKNIRNKKKLVKEVSRLVKRLCIKKRS